MSRLLSHSRDHVRPLAIGVFAPGFALSAQAAPEMFGTSFIFHAWGHDISSGATSPCSANTWNAAPLGYDCQSAEPFTTNGGVLGLLYGVSRRV
jgi:hypothetical protein